MRPFTAFVKKKFGDQKLVGAEVGVQRGDNALTLVEALQFRTLYLIDIWTDYVYANKYGEGVSRKNFSNFLPIVKERFGDRHDIKILQTPSIEAAKVAFNNSFDFVYLDACHSYEAVRDDIKAWLPIVKVGGVLGGHDYSEEIYPGLFKAVSEFIVESGYGLRQESLDWWIIKE